MDASLFARGVAIGFSIAAPVGPIGVLCIRRTLADGRLAGLVTGLGAATADACYGGVAGFGLTAVSGLLLRQQVWVRLLGGLILCYLGLKAIAAAGGRGLPGAYASALALTLTNPLTILSFAAIFAGLGAGTAGGYRGAAALVLGVLSGSTLWWLLLSGGIGLMRGKATPRLLRWVGRLSGGILLGFGLLAFTSLR